MNSLEQKLRAELRAESELITPASLRPLNLRGHGGSPSARPLPAVERRRRMHQAWLAPVAAAASVAVIAAVIGIVSHRVPRIGQEPTGAGMPTAGQLQGIDALSAHDAWAVGYLNIGRTRWSNMTDAPLILHWDGSRWRRVAVPTEPGGAKLYAIAGSSADDLWAVGSGRLFEPVIMHWNGRKWHLEHFADVTKAGGLQGVAATSATDAWAVGQTGGQKPGVLILHWNGSTWKRVRSPDLPAYQFLHSVTAISADDAWAVGDSQNSLLILHWNGSSWTPMRGPNLHGPTSWLGSLAPDPAGRIWAAGFTGNLHLAGFIMRWTGTAWHLVPGMKNGAGEALYAVTAASPRNVWAAGDTGTDTVILRWNGTSWSRATGRGSSFRGRINGLAAVTAHDIWAVGYRGTWSAGVPQILYWNGSNWTRAYGPASTGGLFENSSCGPYCSDTGSATRSAQPPGQ